MWNSQLSLKHRQKLKFQVSFAEKQIENLLDCDQSSVCDRTVLFISFCKMQAVWNAIRRNKCPRMWQCDIFVHAAKISSFCNFNLAAKTCKKNRTTIEIQLLLEQIFFRIVQKSGVVQPYLRKWTTISVTVDGPKSARFSNFCRKQNYRTVIGPQTKTSVWYVRVFS